jgi:hypothetical protein
VCFQGACARTNTVQGSTPLWNEQVGCPPPLAVSPPPAVLVMPPLHGVPHLHQQLEALEQQCRGVQAPHKLILQAICIMVSMQLLGLRQHVRVV